MNKQEIINELIEVGGCDAEEEWSKGYDAAIGLAISIVEKLNKPEQVVPSKMETTTNPTVSKKEIVVPAIKDMEDFKEELRKIISKRFAPDLELDNEISMLIDELDDLEKLDETKITEGKAWEVVGEAYADSEKGRLMNAKKIFDNGLEMQGVINTVMFELKKSNDDRTFGEFVIDSIKKTELPVIPQFVADWIEKCREDSQNLYGVYHFAPSKVSNWVFNDRTILIARAWLDGYTIEQPKLLTVIVKDYDKTIMSKQMSEDEVNKMMEGLEK